MKRFWILSLILYLFIGVISVSNVSAGSGKNSLTLINQSGDHALVKLIGPSKRVIEVPDGKNKTVNIAGGTYTIYVRYGDKPYRYRYARGESFYIEDTALSYTVASLTLHGVVNGNYHTETSTEYEFNRY